jgi:hypothetical protein
VLLPPLAGEGGDGGGRGAVLTPAHTLTHQGGGERFEGAAHDLPTLVSLTGEGRGGGEIAAHSASPVKWRIVLQIGDSKPEERLRCVW